MVSMELHRSELGMINSWLSAVLILVLRRPISDHEAGIPADRLAGYLRRDAAEYVAKVIVLGEECEMPC